MEQHQGIESVRNAARQDIFALREKIAPSLIFNLLGRIFPILRSTQSLLFWMLNIVFVSAMVFLPGWLISIFLKEFEPMKDIWLSFMVGVEISICALLLVYIVARNILSKIANTIISRISNPESIMELRDWLVSSWSLNAILSYLLPIWIMWMFLSVGGISYSRNQFVGFGASIITIPTGFIIGTSAYFVFWMMRLPAQLGNCQYELNNFVPANSEVVNELSRIFNVYLYAAAAFFAGSTLLSSFLKFANIVGYPFVFAGWAMITAQFLVNRSVLEKIISKAKWKTINKLQRQMNELQEKNLAEKEAAEALVRLADLSERILNTHATATDSKAFLTFFSQMMLPLLGLLLANLDKILKLLL